MFKNFILIEIVHFKDIGNIISALPTKFIFLIVFQQHWFY